MEETCSGTFQMYHYIHFKDCLKGERFLLIAFISKLMAASCITLMFLRNLDESGDPLHRRQPMGSLIGGPFYMLAIYVAFSWMELFKPNKTAPLWPFFKSYSCGKQDSEG